MAQRTAPPQGRYFVDAIEPPSRLPSPWATMTTPSPSPGPPPSPAVWQPHDWTPVARKTAPMRSLPLLPSNSANASAGHETHELQPLRTNTTYSPLPTHPEFLCHLQSHPMIIERAGAESLTRTPSPASSVEFVHQPTPGPFATGRYRAGALVASPVPFPSDVRFASPSPANSGFSSPRPLPNVYGSQQGSQHGSQHSLRSMPSSRPTPSASPESAAALSSPRRNPVAMPRARVPAIGASAMTAAAHEQPRAPDYPRHPVFYMQEGMVVLKVQESLYKIHRYLLEHHSDYFRRVVAEGNELLGRSDETPLPLPADITQQGFDCLLDFLYHGIYDPASVSLADWTTILRVSTRLQCTKVRQYAIRELTARRASLPTIDTIVLAKEYDIPSWLGPAYAELVRRLTPLSDDDAEHLGARTAAQVARAREMLREEEYALFQQRRYGTKYVLPERPDEQLVAHAVNEVFHISGAAA
ncbi:hypothetical protein TRAPUB_8386 [Trametes pubescens]|uniref:BTB domain-containing protein n=1 Tax=Trametes pubescens TaxID=154538 RepID=A0A1M2W5B7_TRAPU|nr:hypothetical protein TRAPUB_8386 [Trametes pubescens]